MGICSSCKKETKYQYIIYLIFILNRNLDCHVPADKGTMPRWKINRHGAICHPSKESPETSATTKTVSGGGDIKNLQQFEISGDCNGFHVYHASWKPYISQQLEMKQECGNVYDLFAISIMLPYVFNLQLLK